MVGWPVGTRVRIINYPGVLPHNVGRTGTVLAAAAKIDRHETREWNGVVGQHIDMDGFGGYHPHKNVPYIYPAAALEPLDDNPNQVVSWDETLWRPKIEVCSTTGEER